MQSPFCHITDSRDYNTDILGNHYSINHSVCLDELQISLYPTVVIHNHQYLLTKVSIISDLKLKWLETVEFRKSETFKNLRIFLPNNLLYVSEGVNDGRSFTNLIQYYHLQFFKYTSSQTLFYSISRCLIIFKKLESIKPHKLDFFNYLVRGLVTPSMSY